MTSLANYSQNSVNNPTAALSPIRNAGLQGINQQYAAVPDQVARSMASRGYGSSGAMGNAMFNTNLARAGSVAGLEGQLAQMGLQNQQFGASLGNQLLNTGKGSASDAYGTTWNKGTGMGTSTTPNTSLASGLLGAGSALGNLGNLAGLYGLLNSMGGVGGGGGILGTGGGLNWP
jgi:hypothetical protein